VFIKFLLDWSLVSAIIYWISLFLAPFAVLDCFRKIAYGTFDEAQGESDEVTQGSNIFKKMIPGHAFNFKDYGVLPNLIVMTSSAVLILSICLLKDHLVFERLSYKLFSKKLSLPQESNIDDDVSDEIGRIKKMTPAEFRSSNLVLNGLTKFYNSRNKKILAVNQLHLTVDNAECFGLLGVNGAGKTSTFQMMVRRQLDFNPNFQLNFPLNFEN
jgi:ABC-type multidrug transport system fused ATPase/permease subunit